jgi:membrane protease subunit HflC
MPALIKSLIAFLAVSILAMNTFFVVSQTQQALVLQFGQIVRVVGKPGLKAKIPFVQNLMFFDKRILDFTAQPAEFITHDVVAGIDERVVIDAFVRYRITDPVKFYQAVKTEENLKSRLGSVVLSAMRRTLAAHSLSDLLSAERTGIMREIKDGVNAAVHSGSRNRNAGFGIEVVDLRIIRADLPADISQATYERMRKNFTKEAQLFRAEGDEQALETRSAADRERVEILATARQQAETLRGEGDAEAAKIYAGAFNRDPQFFRFYRSMQAYRKALGKDDTTLILSPDNSFLKEMNTP